MDNEDFHCDLVLEGEEVFPVDGRMFPPTGIAGEVSINWAVIRIRSSGLWTLLSRRNEPPGPR